MQMIRAGAGDDVDHRAPIASIFGAELGLQVEFLDGVDRQQRSRGAADPGLVESGIVEEGIVVVGAIERVIVGAVAVAVDVELSKPELGAGDAGRFDGGSGTRATSLPKSRPFSGKSVTSCCSTTSPSTSRVLSTSGAFFGNGDLLLPLLPPGSDRSRRWYRSRH